jgi:hypothetical protein
MPMKKEDYHPGWREISWAIIHIRAKNHCELCNAENGKPHWKTGSRVVLTTAHINQDKTDNDFVNLLAVCQRCHFKIDAPYRKRRLAGMTADIFMQAAYFKEAEPKPDGEKEP